GTVTHVYVDRTMPPNVTILDPNFGSAGTVTGTSGSTDSFGFRSLILLPDGKFLAGMTSSQNFSITRYIPNGTVDSSFGTKTVDFGGTNDTLVALLAQPDGKIVAVGSASGDVAIARLLENGNLDTSFNSTGKRTTNIGSNETVAGAALQDDGKIVVV